MSEPRRLHLAGSTRTDADLNMLRYAHALVDALVETHIAAGGQVTVMLADEPMHDDGSTSIIFDWTVIDAYERTATATDAPPLTVVATQKKLDSPPEDRAGQWRDLLSSGRVNLDVLPAGVNFGAARRQRIADHTDVLVTVGGGEGVAHLAELMSAARRTVIPIDLDLPGAAPDAQIGGRHLYAEILAKPDPFLRLDGLDAKATAARLAAISVASQPDPGRWARDVYALIDSIQPPASFIVRLQNATHGDFADVEDFVRNVVEPVAAVLGYQTYEVGQGDNDHAFMNIEIFTELHHSVCPIVDLTGLRPNCFIELGYALASSPGTIVTAKKGTVLPFDVQAIPTHFWDPAADLDQRREALTEFWRKNRGRPPIAS